MQPMPHYLIVKVPKSEERDRRDKIGSIFVPPSFAFMTRNTQAGEIVAIGSKAGQEFPDAKPGHILIFHHFVQGSSAEPSEQLIDSDNVYNYYFVCSDDYNGRFNQCYAIWDGEKIIPHMDFILLEPEKDDSLSNLEEIAEKQTQKVGKLIIFKEWKESRQTIERKIESLKAEITSLNKTRMRPDVKKAIEEKEAQQMALSAKLHKKEYKPYSIAYANPNSDLFNHKEVWCLNTATATIIEIFGKSYHVVNVKYAGAVAV